MLNRILFLGLSLFLLLSCSSKPGEQNKDTKTVNPNPIQKSIISEKEETEEYNRFDNSWGNPALLPVGTSIGKFIRAYYLVGDFKKMTRYLILPECLSEEEAIYKLRNYSWGYEMKLNNLEWLPDSNFILTYRTTIDNTIGIEQLKGKIVRDTARIFFFGNQKDHLKYTGNDRAFYEFCEIKQLTQKIQFNYDSDQLTNESDEILNQLAPKIKNLSSYNIEIQGHTSNEGSAQYNLQLSEKRARNVYRYMVEQGVPSKHLSYKGYGKDKPIYSNNSESNREKNRRVEFSFHN